MNAVRISIFLWMSILLTACGLSDHGTEWQEGPYALQWVNLSENVSLSYSNTPKAWFVLVNHRVFAVGSNNQFIVAKQYPEGNKSRLNYFIVVREPKKDGTEPQGRLIGPLSEGEFNQHSKEKNLPKFTTVLEYLK